MILHYITYPFVKLNQKRICDFKCRQRHLFLKKIEILGQKMLLQCGSCTIKIRLLAVGPNWTLLKI